MTVSTCGLRDEDFDRVRAILEARAGLRFDDSRRGALAAAVGDLTVAAGLDGPQAYLDRVEVDADAAQRLIDAVTIPETHFFRNPPQVHALATHVLPELLREALATTGRLRVWSAGCSTGEEPYTVAMLLLDAMAGVPGARELDVTVEATDISSRVLAAAERGEYGARSVAQATPDQLARHFVRTGDRWRVTDEVRSLVRLRRHNLAGDLPPVVRGESLDLVLCRNVTIYFDRETTRALMARLHGALRDGGYLFLGHSETLWQLSEDFRLVTLGDAFVYRRDDSPVSERRQVLPDRRDARSVRPLPGLEERRRGPRRLSERLRRSVPATRPAPGSSTEPASGAASSAGEAAGAGAVPPTGAVTLIAAREALAHGRYSDAVTLAAELVRVDPLDAGAQYVRGHALTSLGEDASALHALRAATYADPGFGMAWFLLGGVLGRLGQAHAARLAYSEAAVHLGGRDGDAEATELGGRSLAELVSLCLTLADGGPP